MPYDLMKTSLFSEEWCEGSNPHTAAPKHLWLDRPEANPLHRTCESLPVSCSLLLLPAASVVPCALCSSLCRAGQSLFSSCGLCSHATRSSLPRMAGRQPRCFPRLCPHSSLEQLAPGSHCSLPVPLS